MKTKMDAKIQLNDSGCMEWVGAINHEGYGMIGVKLDGKRRQLAAHRASWMVNKGPIPPRMVLDHLCRTRNCVNVDHLEPVSEVENTMRGLKSRREGGVPLAPSTAKTRYIHGIPDELWDPAKEKAAAQGTNLSEVIRRLLTEWLKEGTK